MTTINRGINQYKNAIMLDRVKQWCILNPGKKALLARVTGSQVLTYDAGSKVFIYSPVKVVEPTFVIDELSKDWYKERYISDFKSQYMGDWNIRKESKLK
jgi:hypothetical protein